MAKKHIFYLCACLCAVAMPLSMDAHKIGNQARMMHGVRDLRTSKHAKAKADNAEMYVPVVVKLTDDATDLPEYLNVLHRRDRLVLATVAESDWDKLYENDAIKRVESSLSAEPQMDIAKTYCNFPLVGRTEQNPDGLTGKNVVVGLHDVGIDFNHIMLLNEDGTSRFKRWVHHDLYSPYPTVRSNSDDIKAGITDTPDECHGTHTSTIMAGYYPGCPYNGIATESDIVVSTGDLYDAFILNGLEEVLDYAAEAEKPAVLSLSISNYTGAHDGTSLFEQYIDQIGNEAPVMLAIGNEGAYAGAIQDFALNKPLISYVTYGSDRVNIPGTVDIWSKTAQPVALNLVRYNNSTQTRISEIAVTDGKLTDCEKIYVSDDLVETYPWCEEERLPEGFSGYIYVLSEINPENNRYNVTIAYRVGAASGASPSTNEVFGIEIAESEGCMVDIYSSSGVVFRNFSDEAATAGSTDGNISSMCTANNVVSVGAFVSRDYDPHIDGTQVPSYYNPTDAPAMFSSYSTKMPDGHIYPDMCAPGSIIVAAYSSPYVNSHSGALDYAGADSMVVDGNTYYMMYLCGTSMSAPYVAGVAALLLSAMPDLSAADIRTALTTSVVPQVTEKYPLQWGKGMLDCEGALSVAKGLSGVNVEAVADKKDVQMTLENGKTLRVKSSSDYVIRLVDMQGRVAESVSGSGNTVIDLSHVTSGFYVACMYVDGSLTERQKVAL